MALQFTVIIFLVTSQTNDGIEEAIGTDTDRQGDESGDDEDEYTYDPYSDMDDESSGDAEGKPDEEMDEEGSSSEDSMYDYGRDEDDIGYYPEGDEDPSSKEIDDARKNNPFGPGSNIAVCGFPGYAFNKSKFYRALCK